jgi:hypothetical protein
MRTIMTLTPLVVVVEIEMIMRNNTEKNKQKY